jgi:hypothetical protein
MDGVPLVCLTGRLLELGGDIRPYGEFDPAEAFMQLSPLAPVAVGQKLMLVAGSIGAETDRLHPGREEREGMEEDAELLVAGRDIAVSEFGAKDASEFGPVSVQGLVGFVTLIGEEGILFLRFDEGRIHVEGGMTYGVLLMDGGDKVGINLFESRQEFGQWRDYRLTVETGAVRVKAREVPENSRRGRNRSMLLLSPPSLCFSSFLSRMPSSA